MHKKQIKNSIILFIGQFLIKGSGFIKQLIMAFFLGVSAQLDLLLIAQIVPAILASMFAGGAGEVIVTQQKKGKIYDEKLVLIFVFCITMITVFASALYLGTIPLFINILSVKADQIELFWAITIIIVLSKIPSAIVSSLQHLLYAREKYGFFIVTTIVSEIIGIVTIVYLVKSHGVIAFAYGILITSLIKAIFFLYIQKLNPVFLLHVKTWIDKKEELFIVLKRTFSLSIQTFLNQISTFWERILSFRFLQPGFLSALNYSKNLTQLPKLALLSSILTTTYIEQMNKKNENENEYLSYSHKMEIILSEISFLFQMLSLVFGPLILMVLFRRGAFDNDAVETSFLIFQILSIGFLPGLMMEFLSRTMYIEQGYKTLLKINIFKFFIEVILMVAFIQVSEYVIPITLVIGKFFVSITLFIFLLRKHPGIFNVGNFIRLYVLLLIFSIVILIINQILIDYLLQLSSLELILYYSPLILISMLVILWGFKKKYATQFHRILFKK